jgi:hypothetical protein
VRRTPSTSRRWENSPSTKPGAIHSALVSFVLALVAVLGIGRSGTVPRPWNWAPSWCLIFIAAVRTLQFALLATPRVDVGLGLLLGALETVANVGFPIGLGVLAIVLALRHRSRTTHVYPGPDALE